MTRPLGQKSETSTASISPDDSMGTELKIAISTLDPEETSEIEILKIESKVRTLLRGGANANDTYPDGDSHLHKAAHLGNVKIAEELLKMGADVNAKDHKGRTSLYISASYRDLPLTHLLASHWANVNTPYTDKKSTKNQTLLHLCTSVNFPEIVEVLLDSGADIDKINSKGETALFTAIMKGHDEIALKIMDKLSHEKDRGKINCILKNSKLTNQEDFEILKAIKTFVNNIADSDNERAPKIITLLTTLNPKIENDLHDESYIQVGDIQGDDQDLEETQQRMDMNTPGASPEAPKTTTCYDHCTMM